MMDLGKKRRPRNLKTPAGGHVRTADRHSANDYATAA
jgi:hypothetical protein